ALRRVRVVQDEIGRDRRDAEPGARLRVDAEAFDLDRVEAHGGERADDAAGRAARGGPVVAPALDLERAADAQARAELERRGRVDRDRLAGGVARRGLEPAADGK